MLETTEFALLRRIAAEQAERRAPSLIAAVVRGQDLLWSGARGNVDGSAPTADTQYRIGSITKTFIAVLVMRLRDEGLLDLNDLLDKHVSGTSFGHLTVAQLLAHTAGLTSESPGEWWERAPGVDWPALVESMSREPARHRAGERFHYSNVGYGALGQLIAELRGMSWTSALAEEVLAPLGMTRTTAMPAAPHAPGLAVHPYADVLMPEPTPDAGAMAPAGQLWSTLADLARWVRFIGGDTAGVLAPETVAEMRFPAAVEDGMAWTSGYGLGLQTFRSEGRQYAGHGGSMPGFLASVVVDPTTTTGAVAMTNTTAGVGVSALTFDLIKLVDEYEPALPVEWVPQPSVPSAMLALTGEWFWGPIPFVLRLLGDGWLDLRPPSGTGRGSRFRPVREDVWEGLEGYYAGETLRVHRHADGSPHHMDLATFVFTRTPYDPTAPIPGSLDLGTWPTEG
ncbi:MAG: serine hydrolase domain-containing protein [Actinophytocola sp.]|uniref:serine hydrolase domain-containing protein n=1 Tax=Actinophytocola sp. TaxID=1872138 RepID=UPI003D6B0C94